MAKMKLLHAHMPAFTNTPTEKFDHPPIMIMVVKAWIVPTSKLF